MGQTSGKIFDVVKQELEKENKTLDIYMCEDINSAIQTANKNAKSGQIVLFSPASASFDMFKNAVERGKIFKKLVNEL